MPAQQTLKLKGAHSEKDEMEVAYFYRPEQLWIETKTLDGENEEGVDTFSITIMALRADEVLKLRTICDQFLAELEKMG